MTTTLLQARREAHKALWPDQAKKFDACSLVRPKAEIRGSLGLHAAAGEVLLARTLPPPETAIAAWAMRTETWIYLKPLELELLDDAGQPLDVPSP